MLNNSENSHGRVCQESYTSCTIYAYVRAIDRKSENKKIIVRCGFWGVLFYLNFEKKTTCIQDLHFEMRQRMLPIVKLCMSM